MTTVTVPDDATVEAILRRAWIPPDGADLPALRALSEAVDAIRRSADEAVSPTAELARRIALGDFAGIAPAPVPRRHTVRTRIGERVAAMSLRAKLVAVSAVAFTSVTGVAAAGALPHAAQQRVESVIESVTPISFDDHAEFGQDVAEDAQDGGVDGQEISEDAHEQGNRPDDPGQGHEPGLPDLPATVPTTPGEHRPDDPGRPDDRPGADPTVPVQPPVDPGDRPADSEAPPNGSEDRRPTELPQGPSGEQRP